MMGKRKGFVAGLPPLTWAFAGVVLVIISFVALAVGDACGFCTDWQPLGDLIKFSWLTISLGLAGIVYDMTRNPIWTGGILILAVTVLRFVIGIGGI